MPFFDGRTGQVHYRRWKAASPVASLVFLHGMGQHSGHYHRFARMMTAAGIEAWGVDLAGHGLSEGVPGQPGVLTDLAADAAQLSRIAEATLPGIPMALMGHSLGAAVSMTLIGGGAPEFRCAVLCGTPKTAVGQGSADAMRASGLPMLVVHGVDDRIAPIDAVRAWASGIESVEFQGFEDAGHDLLHEKVHGVVTSAVRDFVRSSTGGVR